MNVSLEAIKNKFVFLEEGDHPLAIVDFTEEQKNTILGYFYHLYQSENAKTIFNQINQIDEPIRIFASNSFGVSANLPSLGGNIFDPKPAFFFDMGIFIDEYTEEFKQEFEIKEFKKGYISETGEFVKYDVRLVCMHELIHVTGLTDNENNRGFTSRSDTAGPTQVEANKIHTDFSAPLRISYDGQRDFHQTGEESVNSSIEIGTQFTKDKRADGENPEITLGVFVKKQNVDTSSNNPVTNDLLISGGSQGDRNFTTGAGNDYLYGGRGNDTFKSGADADYLYGGRRNDNLDGGTGEDIAEFIGKFKDYDYDKPENSETITLDHVRGFRAGEPSDGTDTLKNIEWALFQDEKQNIARRSTSDSSTVTRVIPLPLEDGVEETVSEEVYVEPPVGFAPDPVTPPHVSLTAPIAMLDGDVDFTLNISPYEPNVDHNITYIIDTSYSMLDRGNLEPTKDAYTDLTNYFIDNELAENTNFNIIQFSRYANSYSNLSAEQAISTIQNLVTAPARDGTKYNDALYQGFNRFAQSAATDATDIAYFVADGKSQTNFFDPNDVSYTGDAQLLRAVANVQAFGISDAPFEPGAVTTGQINFVDSNQGVIVDDVANLSSELQKSGLAGSVESVNILLDGEVVETVTPNQLTDTPLGLIYEGSVDELDVSIGAENIITTEVVFTPVSNLENTIVEHSVAVGEGEIVDENGNVIDESGGTGGDESGDGDEDDNPF